LLEAYCVAERSYKHANWELPNYLARFCSLLHPLFLWTPSEDS
jgi:hypothetical protein